MRRRLTSTIVRQTTFHDTSLLLQYASLISRTQHCNRSKRRERGVFAASLHVTMRQVHTDEAAASPATQKKAASPPKTPATTPNRLPPDHKNNSYIMNNKAASPLPKAVGVSSGRKLAPKPPPSNKAKPQKKRKKDHEIKEEVFSGTAKQEAALRRYYEEMNESIVNMKKEAARNNATKGANGEAEKNTPSFIPIDVLSRFYPTSAEARQQAKSDRLRAADQPDGAVVPLKGAVPMPVLPPTGKHNLDEKTAQLNTSLLFASYEKEMSKSFINPFSGKLTSIHSPVGKTLLSMGFTRMDSNPLRLQWSPVLYLNGFNETLKKIQKKRKLDSTEGITNSEVVATMGKRLGKSAQLWQEQLMTLLKRDDVFTVMTAELEKRYSAFVQVYMPPRLDSATDPSVSGTVLTPDQSNVLLLAERGYNIYIGGSAGTGKTVLLKSIYRKLSQEGLRVAVTATTGVAAVQLGGCTFHYAFNAPVVLDMSRPQRWDATALRAVDVVIIDEVSLLNASRLDAFDMEARLARMSRAPFGGIQVILCGDFLQLSIEGPDQLDTQPLFQSQAFKNFVQLRLVTPMRHAAGDPLLELLTKLRRGIFDQRMFDQLNRPIPADTTHITYIFPRRREAKQLNERKLEELQSTEHVYIPQRGPLELVGTFTPSAFIDMPLEATSLPSRELVVQLLREEILEVCPEAVAVNELDCVIMPARTAHVSMLMRVRHPDKQLLHRMTPSGPILGASALKPGQWEQVAENVAKKVGGRLVRMYDKEPPNLIPLSVSMTLADMNSSDTSDVLAPLRLKLGCRVMINRNLSRTVSNGSVGVVEAFSEPDPTLFPTGIGSYSFHQLKEKTLFSTLPVVRLLSGEVVQVPPISVASGGTPLTYYYKHDVYPLPLQLGYSFTVHKVQGLTLQGTVVMDCANFFDCPHLLYVACSRVRSLDQLIVYNVEARMISVRRSALQFADGLAEAHNPAILIPPADMPRASWTERTAQRVLKLEE